jgi:hypothetical protein
VVHYLQRDIENVGWAFSDLIERGTQCGFGDRSVRRAALVEPTGRRGALRRDTAWRSMYSDISKRTSSMPMQ